MNSEQEPQLEINQTEVLYGIKLYLKSPYFQRKPKDSILSDEEYDKSVTYGHDIIDDPSNGADDFIDRFSEGYCHGISVLWAYSKWLQTQPKVIVQDGQEITIDDNDWFNYVITLLASWNGKSELTEQECLEINRFISYIQYFQNINYIFANIYQGDLSKSLKDTQHRDLKKEYAIASLLTLEQLKQLLNEKDLIKSGRLILISSGDHTTALFKEDEIYCYFDPNCNAGEVKTASLEEVAELIFIANNFQADRPSPLGFRVFTFSEVDENYPAEGEVLTKIAPTLDIMNEGQAKECSGLEQAVFADSLGSVRYFLEQYNDDDKKQALENQAFIYAVGFGYSEIVKEFLVKKIINPKIVDDDGDNMLMRAIRCNQAEVVRELLAMQEFDPNEPHEEREYTPFMYAVAFGYADTVKAMLASGRIDLNLIDGCGTSALGIALTKGYIEDIAKDILETFISEEQADEKNTALMCAAACNASEVLSRILKARNNSKEYIDRKNSKGFTALMFAVINNDSGIVDKLLASEADPGIINNNGEDAFIIASKKGYLRIVEMLKPKEPTVLKKMQ